MGMPPVPEATRLLVVDDDATTREGLQEFLRDEGFEVCVACDGVQALEMLESFTPALLLTDLEMPHLDGHGLIRQARRNGHWIPIVLVTAHPLVDAEAAANDLGADAYIEKPVDLDDVLSCVRGFV
jgi:two-component system response regulator MprA